MITRHRLRMSKIRTTSTVVGILDTPVLQTKLHIITWCKYGEMDHRHQ